MNTVIKLTLALTLSLSAVALVGCGAQSGTTEVKYNDDLREQIQPATSGGVFALYSSAGLEPIAKYELDKGEPIGFKKGTAEGTVIAVAGDNEVELEEGFVGTYRWKLQD